MEYACTEARFLNDVKDHVMTVIYEDGLNRHLRFGKPGDSSYHFDIVTYCGYLVMTGDMGAWVLSRLKDNFEFIRSKRMASESLYINPQYWAEKIQAECTHGRIKKYSPEKFDVIVRERIEDLRDKDVYEFDDELLNELAEDADIELLGMTHSYDDAHNRLESFNYNWKRKLDFEFLSELYEHNLDEYTFSFIWACYAVAFTVREWDKYKVKQKLSQIQCDRRPV